MNIYNELDNLLEEEVFNIAEAVYEKNELTSGDLKEEEDLKTFIEEQIKEFLSDNYDDDELRVFEEAFNENRDDFFKKHLKEFKAILRDLIRSED